MNNHYIRKCSPEETESGYNWDVTAEQYEKLAAFLEGAEDSLAKAEAFAKEHNLQFYFGPTYGMGGDFIGEEAVFERYADDNYNANNGWVPSAGSC